MAASTYDPITLRMLGKVIESDKPIKSQQKGDPELTVEDKKMILATILRDSPGSFLRRFGSVLDNEDLQYFTTSTEYEVQYHVRQLNRLLKGNNVKKQTSNRRYKAIEELTATTDYFTDREMHGRCPLLYEQYIGQFLSDEERDKMSSCKPGELSLAAHIVNKLDNDVIVERLVQEVKTENGQDGGTTTSCCEGVLTLSADPEQAECDKYMLRKEFLRLMHLRFINGEEEGSVYDDIDTNEEYDITTVGEHDDEELYFDSEEPSGQS